MNLDIQFKLKNNPMYLNYLRQSSKWYKILNRQPEKLSEFIEEMKVAYKLRPQDKIEKIASTVEMISAIMQMK